MNLMCQNKGWMPFLPLSNLVLTLAGPKLDCLVEEKSSTSSVEVEVESLKTYLHLYIYIYRVEGPAHCHFNLERDFFTGQFHCLLGFPKPLNGKKNIAKPIRLSKLCWHSEFHPTQESKFPLHIIYSSLGSKRSNTAAFLLPGMKFFKASPGKIFLKKACNLSILERNFQSRKELYASQWQSI